MLYYGTSGWLEFWGGPITLTAVVGNALMLVIAAAVAIKPFFGPKVETPKHAHEGPVLLFAGPVVLSVLGLGLALIAHTTGELFVGPTLSSLMGEPKSVDLHLWPTKINAPLILSLVTIGLGHCAVHAARPPARPDRQGSDGNRLGAGQGLRPVRRRHCRLFRMAHAAPADRQDADLHGADLRVFAGMAVLLPGYLTNSFPAMPKLPDYRFYEWGILAIAVLGLIAVLIAKTRLTAIVSLGIQGFAVALIFMMFGAPDLSFTQFMVETLSVVILALVMTRLNLSPSDHRPLSARSGPGSSRSRSVWACR